MAKYIKSSIKWILEKSERRYNTKQK